MIGQVDIATISRLKRLYAAMQVMSVQLSSKTLFFFLTSGESSFRITAPRVSTLIASAVGMTLLDRETRRADVLALMAAMRMLGKVMELGASDDISGELSSQHGEPQGCPRPTFSTSALCFFPTTSRLNSKWLYTATFSDPAGYLSG